MQRLRSVSLLVACAVALASSPGRAAAGEPKWVRVTSPSFVVYSDAGEKRASEIAEQLELFRGFLGALFPSAVASSHDGRLPVVAFRDDGAFKPYKPIQDGKPATLSGAFMRGLGTSLVALDASAWDGSAHTIYHEYIHRVLAGSPDPLPLWFNEGLAEFYSTARLSKSSGKGEAVIGRAEPGRVLALRDRGLMPLARLFAVTHDSPEYTERDEKGLFYAQSWAFVHFMIFNEDERMRSRLTPFAVRLAKGEPPEAAFRESFGREMAEVEKDLRRYVGRRALPAVRYDYTAPDVRAALRVEPAPRVEVESRFGDILALSRRYDDAEAQYRRAAGVDPASSLPYEGLGMVALFRGDRVAARAAFAEAVARDSKSPTALYHFARVLVDAPGEADRGRAREALERAIEADPTYARTYGLMARILRREQKPREGAKWAERGLALAPENGQVRIEYALALVESGDLDAGRAELLRVAENGDDERLREVAREAIESLDRAAAGAAR